MELSTVAHINIIDTILYKDKENKNLKHTNLKYANIQMNEGGVTYLYYITITSEGDQTFSVSKMLFKVS